MRKLIYVLIAIVVLFGCFRLLDELLDEFSLDNITLALPDRPEWRIPELRAKEQYIVDTILDQPFHYLGKGHQAYAFESADQRYVLKFIKFTYLKPTTAVNYLPDWGPLKRYKEHVARGKHMRIDRVFAGHRIAYEVDKINSGLIFIHLMPTTTLFKTISLTNRLGRTYTVDLDQHAFILQKKAIPTRIIIQKLLDNRNLTVAKEHLRSILDLYLQDYKKGIYDNDHNVMHNTGFANGKAMRLDVGRLKFDPNAKQTAFIQSDMHKIVYKRIGRWLKKYYAQDAEELIRDMENHLEKYG